VPRRSDLGILCSADVSTVRSIMDCTVFFHFPTHGFRSNYARRRSYVCRCLNAKNKNK